MKIQDLASVVGGFLKILMILFGFVINFLNKNLKKIHLFYEMFDFDLSNGKLEKNDKFIKLNNSLDKKISYKISNI